jgi:hypothetical protein
MGPDVCDRPIDVLVHEDGILLVAPNGLSFAVTLRAAEESATRLLDAVRIERSALEQLA